MSGGPLTVHLVYPHGDVISCPDAIGRKLGERLQDRYEVRYYAWDGWECIAPRAGDVLLGHPHPSPGTTFRRNARRPEWSRVLILSPFNLDLRQVAWLDPLVQSCDLYLAITGNYWFARVEKSPLAHWRPKMVHVDLAVDRSDFPRVKSGFAEPGRRRFLYIGHSGWQKNPAYLSELARRLPRCDFGWIGRGRKTITGFTAHGTLDFRVPEAQALVATYDFLLTVSRNDANPATILEAMGWGLIPVCTPQSGYTGYPGIINIPADDAESAAAILGRLQTVDAGTLERLRRSNDDLLRRHFNWERFTTQVVDAIESPAAPAPARRSHADRLRLRAAGLVSPYSRLRPRNLAADLRRLSIDLSGRARRRAS